MLELVELLVNELVGSDSWPGESLVVQSPGLDARQRRVGIGLSQLSQNLPPVGVELLVESAGESLELKVHLSWSDLQGWSARGNAVHLTQGPAVSLGKLLHLRVWHWLSWLNCGTKAWWSLVDLGSSIVMMSINVVVSHILVPSWLVLLAEWLDSTVLSMLAWEGLNLSELLHLWVWNWLSWLNSGTKAWWSLVDLGPTMVMVSINIVVSHILVPSWFVLLAEWLDSTVLSMLAWESLGLRVSLDELLDLWILHRLCWCDSDSTSWRSLELTTLVVMSIYVVVSHILVLNWLILFAEWLNSSVLSVLAWESLSFSLNELLHLRVWH